MDFPTVNIVESNGKGCYRIQVAEEPIGPEMDKRSALIVKEWLRRCAPSIFGMQHYSGLDCEGIFIPRDIERFIEFSRRTTGA